MGLRGNSDSLSGYAAKLCTEQLALEWAEYVLGNTVLSHLQ